MINSMYSSSLVENPNSTGTFNPISLIHLMCSPLSVSFLNSMGRHGNHFLVCVLVSFTSLSLCYISLAKITILIRSISLDNIYLHPCN